jgi:hypothetical protein
MISIRPATEKDVHALCALDLVAHSENERREFIGREVRAGNCFVAVASETILGYAVLNYTFFHQGFIEMLYIDADRRRAGAGTEKLFTSTNLSNLPMQSLLAKMDYALSGVIHNLDEGDPEIVYFKRLR